MPKNASSPESDSALLSPGPKRPSASKQPQPAKKPRAAVKRPAGGPKQVNPPAKQPANRTAKPAKKVAPPAAADEEKPQGDTKLSRVAVLWSGSPSWLVSTVLHTVALLMLALWTLALPEDPAPRELYSAKVDADDEIEELDTEFELDLEELEETPSVPTDIPDPGAAMLSEVNAVSEMDAVPLGVGEMAESPVGEIGALFGTDGKGMAAAGEGTGGAMFFGTRSQGRRFVFVVDNSNSMTRGKFETALDEMVKAVERLSTQQQFYVIFYSDAAYPLFHPQGAKGFVNPTSVNKDKLRSWLYTVELCLRTDGEEAMARAVAMNPDVIYVLGDGAFTDNTEKLMTGPLRGKVTVHTLGMGVKGKGQQQMEAIAAANGGTYKDVGISPEAAAAAQKRPIPRNNSRGPVWGIKLPNKKK